MGLKIAASIGGKNRKNKIKYAIVFQLLPNGQSEPVGVWSQTAKLNS